MTLKVIPEDLGESVLVINREVTEQLIIGVCKCCQDSLFTQECLEGLL